MAIEVGSKLQGKVTGITNFGAFVELPEGQTGLVHISEVADNYVKDINDHLKVGDVVEVKVINEKDGKIGLSIKKAIDRPERPERPSRPEPARGRHLRAEPSCSPNEEIRIASFHETRLSGAPYEPGILVDSGSTEPKTDEHAHG